MDKESDRRWLIDTVRRAETGDKDAMETLDGLSGRRIEGIGTKALDSLAAEGSSWAMVLMGRVFEQRGQASDDLYVAMDLYRNAAGKANPYAMVAMARVYEKDERLRSFRDAYVQYRRAASMGCAPAERWMDENGERGRCQADLDRRLEEGDPDAMYEIGLMHEEGE